MILFFLIQFLQNVLYYEELPVVILTKKQHNVYQFIQSFIEDNKYSPSLEEIAKGVGLRSIATVHKHIQNLVEKGLLKKPSNKRRSLEVSHKFSNDLDINIQSNSVVDIPLLGKIAAGSPIEAISNASTLSIPEDMLGNKETYALYVEGNSMIDEHICSGDYVIIESRSMAENGETVVALLNNNDVTLKKFYHEGKYIRLQPANVELSPLLVPANNVTIQGVVIGLIRKFSNIRNR